MNNIIGHKKQKQILRNFKEVPHALVFEGEDMIGKKTMAIAFAKLILCDYNACNTCKTCIDISKNISPDLLFILPENNNIEINKIRELKTFLSFKSFSNKKKIAIIDDAHLMNNASQNSILKLLEEPPKDSILILITNFKDRLLKTIRSRVQEISFNKVLRKEIEDYLEEKGLSKEEVQEISFFSGGKPGKALEFFNDPLKKEFFKKTITYLNQIKTQELQKRFAYVETIYKDKEIASEILDIFERFFRREMLLKLYSKHGINDSLLQTKNIISKVQETKYFLNNTNTNKKLLLENLMINI